MSDEAQSGSEPSGTGPKIIKRYTNRKLYDTEESRYVTLDEISEMVRSGAEVKIVDNRSKDDLTSVTLAQIIFEEEKKRSQMPLSVLRAIIRSGGEAISEYLHSGYESVGQRVATIREEADGLRHRLLNREGEKPVEPPAPPRAKTIEQARELVAQSQRVLEDWQKRIDDRVHDAVENITSLPALARDLAALDKRIRDLEARLDDLEKPE